MCVEVLTNDSTEASTGMNVTTAIRADRAILEYVFQRVVSKYTWSETYADFRIVLISRALRLEIWFV